MLRSTIVLTLVSVFAANNTFAAPVSATYDSATGNVVIDVNNVVNWYIEHEHISVLTGAAPVGLNPANGLITDNDVRLGQSGFAPFSYPDLDLGPVAQTGLVDDGSFKIFWNNLLGEPTNSAAISFYTGPPNSPPTAGITGPTSINIFSDPLDVLFDASSSSDDGLFDPLTYEWDLNNDGVFEFDTFTNPTLAIADVTQAFGGVGDYPVTVRVFDGQHSDTASMNLNLFYEPLANPGFEIPENTAPGHFPYTFGDWAGDISEIVTAQNGVTPAEGDKMLRFLNTAPVGPTFPGTGSDVWQLVDVSSLATEIAAGGVVFDVSAVFNRIAGDLETDSEFRIEINALDGVPDDFFAHKVAGSELAKGFDIINTDGDSLTWEEANTSLLLPAGTEYIAIMVNATENTVNDSVDPEFDGHYADDVELTFNLVVPGDLNGDGFVDAADAGYMFVRWGSSTTLGYYGGNINGDTYIDAADAGIMFANWTGDVGPHSVSVPEPSSLLLIGLGGVFLCYRRRQV